jgi:four helix bundle protein
MNEKGNPLKDKSFSFALRIVKLYRFLCEEKREFVLSKQILKSGTSIGANIREAQMRRVKLILSINFQLLKKKQMKPFIGWNY